MAKVITQPKRGSVGPSTFLHSRHGVIERQRVVPLNPKTLAQQTQRGILSAVTSEWRGLSDEARAGWTVLASQVPGKLTGAQLYTKLNAVLVSCGMPKLEEAPDVPTFGILSCTGLAVDDTPTVRLTQVSSTAAPDKFIVEAAAPVGQGIQNVNTRFRHLAVVAGHGAPAANLDLTAAYTARFGAPKAGKRVVVRITAMKDGFKGQTLQFSALVSAGEV